MASIFWFCRYSYACRALSSQGKSFASILGWPCRSLPDVATVFMCRLRYVDQASVFIVVIGEVRLGRVGGVDDFRCWFRSGGRSDSNAIPCASGSQRAPQARGPILTLRRGVSRLRPRLRSIPLPGSIDLEWPLKSQLGGRHGRAGGALSAGVIGRGAAPAGVSACAAADPEHRRTLQGS